jgi:hypothetical protein
MKTGKLAVYSKERIVPRDIRGRRSGRSKMGPVRNRLPLFLDAIQDDARYYRREVELMDVGAKHLGFESMKALVEKEFPLLPDFDPMSPGVPNLLRNETVTGLSRQILGKHFQKGVPRALAGMQPSRYGSAHAKRTLALQIVMTFQGIVPTDWIVSILEAQIDTVRDIDSLFRTRDGLRELRRFLRTGTETQLRRLTRNPDEEFTMLFRDSFRNMETLQDVGFRDLRDLHDTVAPRIFRRIETADREIVLKEQAEKFLGEDNGFSIIAPKSTKELFDWSNRMHNCISGYGHQAADGSTLLFAVMKGEDMVSNIELAPDGSVRQLLGKHNASVDRELSDAVKNRIRSVWPKANVDSGWE